MQHAPGERSFLVAGAISGVILVIVAARLISLMNALESQLDYVFGDTLPEPGHVMEVAPGVRWLRMGLPFALNHINLWLLADEMDTPNGRQRGWTVVDCGIATEDTRQAWERIFADELEGLPILRVLVTHCHPDHVGLAEWLCQRWQAPLWMSTGEYAFARVMSAALPGAEGTAATPHFQRHGLADPQTIATLQGRNTYYQDLVPAVPRSYHRMQDGHAVAIGGRDWEIITGFGHSPEHVSLYCRDLNVLISGDMVLPRISTNVSVFAIEPESNPVQQYLDSLKKYAQLPADALVLPSHGKPFRGLHTRIEQLNDHHRQRLAEVLEACATPQTGVDILPVMFKRALDTHQLSFALGEAVAHLHKLWYDGAVRRLVGEDGVYRFVVV
ncbi:Zn-dependent hydrolase (glyoxylase) protein [Herbaspirillum seropedicae SmR1]|uniref:Zn-dependent hydrolase (Glyoxylase) protein n=2 Tax=Herbaspirillum seropedicae TaxID=964 RepID=D8IY29_HERSS|nr:Zn-dependent hydrolase (glyoxylase) protein [Herbaspirillum seropedicae SmR1]